MKFKVSKEMWMPSSTGGHFTKLHANKNSDFILKII